MRLFIDNWRWDGVPIYLRSGKALWKRGTEIMVQFKKAPEVIFRDTAAAGSIASNRLIFHIQPDQGIELRFHAKTPGPQMQLQKVNMRFDYREAFEASRGTGYEVLLYNCMIGDATLFSRTDLVEIAWRIAQPLLDTWKTDDPKDFPNYPAGSWGPRAAYELIESDGRQWVEIVNREVLDQVPLFHGSPPSFLQGLAMMLKSDVFDAGDAICHRGEPGNEMYFIARGQAEVLDQQNKVVATLPQGSFFGEIALLTDQPRTATIRAKSQCDLYVLDKTDFQNALRNHPEFAKSVMAAAEKRYNLAKSTS
jgi:glucose-6-phosphate 1-dehydrogenase